MTASLRYLWLGFLEGVIIFADSVITTKKPQKFCDPAKSIWKVRDCDWRSGLRETSCDAKMHKSVMNIFITDTKRCTAKNITVWHKYDLIAMDNQGFGGIVPSWAFHFLYAGFASLLIIVLNCEWCHNYTLLLIWRASFAPSFHRVWSGVK